MKYLCLAYYDVEKFARLTPQQLEEIGATCRPHDEMLRKSGRLVAGGSLGDPDRGFVLRPKRGQPSIVDGPFAETKEQVGGLMIIEADSREEAIRLASMHPAATMNEDLGWALEVRSIERFSFDDLLCRHDVAAREPA
jgi:hypothetical protein